MSNSVRDVEKLHRQQIETSRRRNERELKFIQNAHQDYKADLRKTQELEVVDIQHAHQGQLSSETEKKEKILNEMRSHLQQTKNLTEKELKNLKDYSQKEAGELQKKLSHDRSRINAEHELFLEELNNRFNDSSRKIGHDGNSRLQEIKKAMNDQKIELENHYQQKIQKQTEDFMARFKGDEKKYQELKDSQDNQFKKERLSTNSRQQIDLSKMTETHNKHIENKDKNFRKGLKDQDLFFEDKYKKQLDRHAEDFKTLEAKNDKVVNELKNSLTKEITKTASRNEDPFYQFQTLEPRLKQFEDRVEVEVNVPDHSKQDVQLTINGKEAIVSFNRRYTDASRSQDGTINKVNKVESFTTRLQAGDFLDAKGVKSSYEDGIMTYVIKKA